MTNRLDFVAIKRGVSLESVLRQYRVQLRRYGRDQYRGCCPIHGGEGRDAFHVNLTRSIFHCFACGAGGTVLDFMAAMEGCTLREAAAKLQPLTPPANPASLNKNKLVTEKRAAPGPLGFALRDVDSTHPYLATRGIANQTAMDFGVGFYPGPGLLSGRLVIPIHNAQGELVAYCGRSLDGTQPRYRFPPGFAKSQILFNFHRAAATGDSSVVVVEGFFDCFNIYQAGIRSVVALMGARLYKTPERALIERFRHVVVMLDGDATGQNASQAIARSLRRQHCAFRLVRLPPNAQPDQLPADVIRDILHPTLPRNIIGKV
jgi:DNA primase